MADSESSLPGVKRASTDANGAEASSPKRPRRSSSTTEEAPTDNKPASEEPTEEEPRDPGKRAYKEFSKMLKTLKSLLALRTSSSESDSVSKESKQKIQDQLQKLRELCLQTLVSDEEPNPWKMAQIQLKHTFLNSEKISEEDNVKNFLTGLEDSSASKSDRDSAVFVFLANFATELWYRWKEKEGEKEEQWEWTPDWEFWMPCSKTVVSEGQWKGETPAPENVEIIRYLDAIRPVPSDEQYLPAFDVLALFEKLHGLSDPEISESLRAIVAVLEDGERNTRSRLKTRSPRMVDFLQKLQKELAEEK